jgi:hypothetical protein
MFFSNLSSSFFLGFLNKCTDSLETTLKRAPLNLINPFSSQLFVASKFMLSDNIGLEFYNSIDQVKLLNVAQ